jgi:hypothetical protein
MNSLEWFLLVNQLWEDNDYNPIIDRMWVAAYELIDKYGAHPCWA